jgi:hypothetical protein
MPHTARRPRASSGRGRAKSASTGQTRPAPSRPRREDPYAALDAALTAAAASPPSAATTFGALGLDDRLVSALEAAGISEPFAIQARALPDALAGRDVLGRAQTGSGKTLAFGLPLLTRLAGSTQRRRERAPRGLILVPTRELAEQVAGVLEPFGRKIGVRTITVYGGVSIVRQIERARGADLVVATPGRLIDLMERGACNLGNIEITVLDEADHMADLGFMPAVTRILDATPAGGQRLLFSATLDRGVGQLVTAYVRDPALHAVAPSSDGVAASHLVLVLAHPDKVPVAAELASGPGRTLFFVRTSCPGPASAPAPSTATGTRTSGSGRSTRSPPGTRASWSPPTWPRAASTSTTWTSWCSSTRPRTTRTTCTGPAAPPVPGPPAWS